LLKVALCNTTITPHLSNMHKDWGGWNRSLMGWLKIWTLTWSHYWMSLEVSVMPKTKKRYNKDLISYRPLVSLISIYISMTESIFSTNPSVIDCNLLNLYAWKWAHAKSCCLIGQYI
jgi:hypothetical protein